MIPYIGITDFCTYAQVQAMENVFLSNLSSASNRQLHVGVMMSYKTLNGIPTRWESIFPLKEKIAEIFSSDTVYNCLHFADYDNEPELWKNLSQALSYASFRVHAVQLDMIWPEPAEIANGIHTSRKQVEVIIQIGKNAFDQIGNDPNALVEKLEDYQGVIHRVLLDKSMGQGVGMNAEFLLPFARAIRKEFPTLGIGVAGGLGPETIHLVKPIAEEFPDVSIDAQARLRQSGSALDPIDWEMAGTYLQKAIKLFS